MFDQKLLILNKINRKQKNFRFRANKKKTKVNKNPIKP